MGAAGMEEAGLRPPAPRLDSLSESKAADVIRLYRGLGGAVDHPRLAPGAWDIAYQNGLVIELDEEMHFTRYRAQTLETAWAPQLPWTDSYRRYAAEHEGRVGTGGRRWSNPSAARLFGGEDPPLTFGAFGGPRWKQRALYDAIKDAAALDGIVTLARVSVHDVVGGTLLNDILYGKASVDLEVLTDFIAARTAQS